MNEKAIKLVMQMVILTIAREKDRIWELYEQYMLETRLHVPIGEYIEWREQTA